MMEEARLQHRKRYRQRISAIEKVNIEQQYKREKEKEESEKKQKKKSPLTLLTMDSGSL